MDIIRTRALARAGLLGNPSDGYHGKTISVAVPDFFAEAVLYEWDQIEIVWSQEDQNRFRSLDELVHDVRLHGYYGGIRLVKATIKKFAEFCQRQNLALPAKTFSIRYQSNIPRQVGLAGSSAIIVATLRALMAFYDVTISKRVQPSLALTVENEELGIAAGLQDRVIQVYEGVVYMDFDRTRMTTECGLACGVYEPLDPALLPPMYLAYDAAAGEPTEVVHNDLRSRYNRGDEDVHEAMRQFAQFAEDGRAALFARDWPKLSELMNANFDLRRSICRLAPRHVEMIETARTTGASAKFAGSGGAIVGSYTNGAMFAKLRQALEPVGCRVLQLTPSA
jgi:glucuronokinase